MVLAAACSSGSSDSSVVVTTAPLGTAPSPGAPTTTTTPTTTAPNPAGSPPTTATAPAGDAFYNPPSPLPAGQPGDIIWARPFAGPSGSRSYQVLYLSRTVDDQPVAVSGVVVAPGPNAPPAPSEGRTVLSWAHGTTGLGDACAPSKQYVTGSAAEELLAQLAVARGFVYVATDYQGLGPPGDHPYLVGLSEGRNVLDAARAAERLTGSGADASSKVLIWGHSQGGGAAAFAAELAPTYASALHVVGAMVGAPATELAAALQQSTSGPYVGFALMAFVGFHAGYPALEYDTVLNAAGQQAVAAIDTECVDAILHAYAGRPLSDFTTGPPTAASDWARAVAANEAGQMKTPVPIFIYQGEQDQIIPVSVSATLLQKYCALGVMASRKTYPGTDHTSVIPAALPDILAFANDRLNGLPAPSSC
jgi:pimeloyl-ACP methyl ester carboxylesterase